MCRSHLRHLRSPHLTGSASRDFPDFFVSGYATRWFRGCCWPCCVSWPGRQRQTGPTRTPGVRPRFDHGSTTELGRESNEETRIMGCDVDGFSYQISLNHLSDFSEFCSIWFDFQLDMNGFQWTLLDCSGFSWTVLVNGLTTRFPQVDPWPRGLDRNRAHKCLASTISNTFFVENLVIIIMTQFG